MKYKNKLNINYWLRKIFTSTIYQKLNFNKDKIKKQVFTSIYKSNHWVQKDDTLSKDSIDIIRENISKDYGGKYIPEKAIEYKSRKKNAQEAHEAIRPTDISIKPDDIKEFLNEDQFKLYDLIWKRTIASQMTSAETNQNTLKIECKEQNITLKAKLF